MFFLSSMILLEIDLQSVAILKCEGYAPGTVHMNGVARRLVPAQCMEIEPGQVHILRTRSGIESFQSGENAFMQADIQFRRFPGLPEIGERPAAKRFEHACGTYGHTIQMSSRATHLSGRTFDAAFEGKACKCAFATSTSAADNGISRIVRRSAACEIPLPLPNKFDRLGEAEIERLFTGEN